MNPSSNLSSGDTAATSSTASTPPSSRPSRLARFFDLFFRYAGAVDHTHMLPLDRVSGRTGIVNPPATRRCGC